jgi:hypothetical protein
MTISVLDPQPSGDDDLDLSKHHLVAIYPAIRTIRAIASRLSDILHVSNTPAQSARESEMPKFARHFLTKRAPNIIK